MSEDKILTYSPPVGREAAWGDMPGMDARTRAHTLSKLPLVRAALTGAKAQILCVHVEMGSKRKSYSCTLWRQSDDGAYDISDGHTHVNETILSEICGSFGPLVRNLHARWPDRAKPKVMGLATDGHRVVFNATNPACIGSGWLDDHLTGRAPGVSIADDGEEGEIDRMCGKGSAS